MAKGVPNATPLERFNRKTKPGSNGCIEWTGKLQHGYGEFTVNYKRDYAHRWAWFFVHGELPKLFVCHSCDNPKCVNIEHLFLGTHTDNMKDAAAKNRMGRPHKYSPSIRNEIRSNLNTGLTQKEIARLFNVSPATVSEISRGVHEPAGRKQDKV